MLPPNNDTVNSRPSFDAEGRTSTEIAREPVTRPISQRRSSSVFSALPELERGPSNRTQEGEPPLSTHQEPPGNLRGTTTTAMTYLASKAHEVDLVGALAPRNDRDFRRLIGPQGAAASTGTVAILEHLERLEHDIGLLEIPQAAKRTLQLDIAEIRSDIAGLTNDKARADYAALVAVRLVLSPLPVLLPLLSNPTQFHGAALIIASVVKTSFIAMGLFLNPTANGKVVIRHAMNRDLANNLQALMLLANIVPTPKAEAISSSVPYNVVVGITGFIVLMVAFYGKSAIKAQYNLHRHGATSPKKLGDYAESLSDESKQFLTQMAGRTHDQYSALQDERRTFKAAGKRLTSSADWQVSQILGGMEKLQQDMLRLAGVKPVEGHNEDKVGKSIMFGISAAVLFAPIIPVTGLAITPKPETIPMVDLIIDYAFTMFHMGAILRNPSASVQEAQDAFAQWVGFSGVMSYCFGANAAQHDPVSKGGKAFAEFAIGLSIANVTLATPLGTTMADFVSLIFNKLRLKDEAGARRDLTVLGEQIMQSMPEIPLQERVGTTQEIPVEGDVPSERRVSQSEESSRSERILTVPGEQIMRSMPEIPLQERVGTAQEVPVEGDAHSERRVTQPENRLAPSS